jgi:hypothetical protein
MSASDTLLKLRPVQEQTPTLRWSLATRVAFRFSFVYFGIYCLGTQVVRGLMPWSDLEAPDPVTHWPVGPIVAWVAAHVFGVKTELIYFSGSGDKTFDWVFAFCLLVFAALAAGIWSILDRERSDYAALSKWFRVFLRFCLAGQMLGYGLAKVIPLQMPFPSLSRLVEPFGNFSLMGVLWSSIGASPAYEIFAGCAETLGGVLLIFPRTTTLGALVCLADLLQIFVLNMTYDVPVKLFSFHLIVMCLVLLAPDSRRLANFFLLNRSASAPTQPPLFASVRRNRIAVAAQIAFGVLLVGMNVYGSVIAWSTYGRGQVRSALYGIWDITELTIDGQPRPPDLGDHARWRRAIFEIPSRVTLQRMDDSTVRYGASIDSQRNTLALSKNDDKNWKANFIFQRPSPNQLILDGDMDNQKIHMQLGLVDPSKFQLVSRGFHWIQEFPFNR